MSLHIASRSACVLCSIGRAIRRAGSPRRRRISPSTSGVRWCAVASSTGLPPTSRAWTGRSLRSSNGSRALIRLLRLVRIFAVAVSYGLHEFMPRMPGDFVLRFIAGRRPEPRGQRLREAFERLGPIFVKFGQVLSTRRDLLPADIADELAKLQDQVPPFDSAIAIATIERAFRRPVDTVFASFEREPVASASIAQVHFATLKDRHAHPRDVPVK